ncbi:Eco57I restriction-modification methylase domain-containing protein [Streptomyces bluensis]|uniref:Eco57I restriction-modification methylase domain-containing protein n=1 Tax=Streptomyces bluensis TaxID=33897 RepID=UPI0033165CCA
MSSPAAASPARVTQPNYGAVFTRRWVVELILDLCGYSAEHDLTGLRAVEPAAGEGAFLEVIVERLVQSRARHAADMPWESLGDAVCAWDLQTGHVAECREKAFRILLASGCPKTVACDLAERWVQQGDFLLLDHEEKSADFVLGNPPYIRIEDVEPAMLAAYRAACPTMGGRADIYVGFIEKGLDLLKPEGRLGLICADRWMRNQYGKRLREKVIAQGYAMDCSLVMHDAPAFMEAVSAYPAIILLRRGVQESAVVGSATEDFGEEAARSFRDWALSSSQSNHVSNAATGARLPHWHATNESWPEGSPRFLAWLEELEDHYEPLEDRATGTRVSIGVATGADAVYVTRDRDAAEAERMLPLSMAADIKSGTFIWGGHYLVNPWEADGLVDLREWPRLRGYLSRNGAAVRRRAIARKREDAWYRTIDRVSLPLIGRQMLLLQDMKSYIHPVLAPEGFYPHHNLYYVVSRDWDLEALGGLLLSEAVERQVAAYCVKMRGKTMRFQAQYLRRVRVPALSDIPLDVLQELKEAFRVRDRARASAAALRAYGQTALPD